MRGLREASERLAGSVVRARRRPFVGGLARMLWRDLSHHCRVEALSGSAESGGQVHVLTALVGKRAVGEALLWRLQGPHEGFSQPPIRWVLTGCGVGPLCEGRGVVGRLGGKAQCVAGAAGAAELWALLKPGDAESLAELEGIGFARLPDGTPVSQLMPEVAEAGMLADSALVLRRPLPSARPTSLRTQ
jgi:hypothetical protein